MNKILLLLALLVLGYCNAQAQDNKPKKEGFSWQKEYMDEAGIAPEVQAKITVLKTESEVNVKAIKKDTTFSEEEKKEKIKEVHKKKSEAINALLSKEQKSKIKEIKERLKKNDEVNLVPLNIKTS
jgi:hypothetical protein